jgi:hypothetical protein
MQGDHRPFGNDPPPGPSMWTIAAGVCLGMLAANTITWVAAELRLRWELQQVSTTLNSTLKDQADQAQRAILKMNRDTQLEQQRQARERERAVADERQRTADQQRAGEDQKRAVQAEVDRKESAWKRFYKPSPGCEAASTSVECANEHIRAKREFEARYAAGKL